MSFMCLFKISKNYDKNHFYCDGKRPKKKQIDFFFQVFTFLEGRYWFHEPFEVWSFDTTITIPNIGC